MIEKMLNKTQLLNAGIESRFLPVEKHEGTGPCYDVTLDCPSPRTAQFFANLLRTWDATSQIELLIEQKLLSSCDEGIPWVEAEKAIIAKPNPKRVAFRLNGLTLQLAPWARAAKALTGVPGAGYLVKAPTGGVVIDPPTWLTVLVNDTKLRVIQGEITFRGLPFIVSWNTIRAISEAGVAWKEGGAWKHACVAPWTMGVGRALWTSPDVQGVAWEEVPFSAADQPNLALSISYLATRAYRGVKSAAAVKERGFTLGLTKLWFPPATDDGNPFIWGLNRFLSRAADNRTEWGIALDSERKPYNGGDDRPHDRSYFDWSMALYLMGTKAQQSKAEVPLGEALRADTRLFTGSSKTYGNTTSVLAAIQAFTALYAGDVALGTTDVRRVS